MKVKHFLPPFLPVLLFSACFSCGRPKLRMRSDYENVYYDRCSIENGRLLLKGLLVEAKDWVLLGPKGEVSIYVAPSPIENPEKGKCRMVYHKVVDAERRGKRHVLSFPDVSLPLKPGEILRYGAMVLKYKLNGTPARLQVAVPVR